MAAKDRATLKAENAEDFQDNTARLISPAKLRGQMDDIVDSMFLGEDLDTPGGPASFGGGGGGGAAVHLVADIAAAKAIPGLTAGSIVFVGGSQFVVVDNAALGTDGGTVFIPDDQLSEIVEEVIPTNAFAGGDVFEEHALAHTGIDFESFELVLTDGGETLDIWTILHGHVMNPGVMPQVIPKLKTAEGKFLDPYRGLTVQLVPPALPLPNVHPPVRTGGILARYKYALSGLRLARITGPIFRLDWWPVVAVDEEAPGTQTDNSGAICWCINAAVAADAEAIYIDRMYHYGRCVEWPNGIEMRGRGPGVSGFRVMDNYAYRELLLSSSSAPDPAENPMIMPATRVWAYDWRFLSNACTFFPQNNATRIRIRGIEFDGNIENNMRFFTEQNAEYAYAFAQNLYLFNTVSYAGFMVTDAGARIIPAGCVIELHDHVKVHGYAHILLGNINADFIQTGTLELGNCITGHWLYQCDGEFEHVRCFGYVTLDGIRCHKFIAKSVEAILAPHPDAIFALPLGDSYQPRNMYVFSTNEAPQFQSAATGYPYPQPSPTRVVIDNVFIDATGLDTQPAPIAGRTYEGVIMISVGADNIHIGSGRLRFGSNNTSVASVFAQGLNSPPGVPELNQLFENLHIEYGSRYGVQLHIGGGTESGPTQRNYRNITIEPRAATQMLNNPTPGTNILLGAWSFTEPPVTGGIYDGYDIEFSAVVAADLSGDWIDITPDDAGAPIYRIWFDYNAGSTAPAAGGSTLVEVDIVTADTAATIAAKFSAAIAGTLATPSVPSVHLTAATFGTKSAVGSYSRYHHETGFGLIAADVTNATGVTAVLRAYRRNYEPSNIGFERFAASDPTYISLMNFATIGAHRDIYFRFKECILGSWNTSYITVGSSGGLHNAGVIAVMDRLHWVFEDTIFDCRDGTTWQNLDLFLYAGKFRNCRVRTPQVSTGLTNMGTGYETLFSEQSGVFTVTPGAGVTTVDIQTKLFWVPKDGNVRIYPADPATAVVWNTNMPSVSWVKSARPISSTYTALGGSGAYYQGPASINEDRRAPALQLTFATAPATALAIGWSAAVSP